MNVSDSTKHNSNSANHSKYFPYKYLAPTNSAKNNALGTSPNTESPSETKKPSRNIVRWNKNCIRKYKRRISRREKKTEETIDNILHSKRNDSTNILLEKTCQLACSTEEHKKPSETATGILDTAATSSCCPEGAPLRKTGRKSTKTFQVATGQLAPATEERELHQNLREPANTVHVVPDQTQDTLISAVKLVDAGYTPILTKDDVKVYNTADVEIKVKRDAILRGWRDADTGLWRIPLEEGATQQNVSDPNKQTILSAQKSAAEIIKKQNYDDFMCSVYELTTQPEIVRFLHAAAGFPTKATWLNAIQKGYFASWPGLTAKAVEKHFPESEETQKGHMRKRKAGRRSTKQKMEAVPNVKKGELRIKNYEIEEEIQSVLNTDQTGKLPKQSSQGNQYLMVAHESTSNAILYQPYRNKSAGELIKARKAILSRLEQCGIKPKHQALDNEISAEYKEAIKESKMTYQLAPPRGHAKMAEKAIQIAKDHFIAILCGTSNKFPLHLWDRLTPKAETTLNMLRLSRAKPTVSAHAYMHGQHDFNSHPLVPLGMETEIYLVPTARDTWAPHSESGYNVATSFEHNC